MQVSSEVIKIFEYLGEKFGIAIDWSSANVWPYLQELFEKFIKWEISTSIAWIVIVSLTIIVLIILGIVIGDPSYWFLFVFAAIGGVVIIGSQTFDIIEDLYFPEKALYDYLNFNGII